MGHHVFEVVSDDIVATVAGVLEIVRYTCYCSGLYYCNDEHFGQLGVTPLDVVVEHMQ